MRLLDARRLTGPNLHLGGPAAIAEVEFEPGEDPEDAVARWRAALAPALAGLGWSAALAVRTHPGLAVPGNMSPRPGADLVFAAPVDALYLATTVQEWAVAAADGRAPELAGELDAWRRELERARRPALTALLAAAAARGLPALLDDDALSLGHGHRSRTWPLDRLPDPADVPWAALARIPVALVTGTNGKTTTARLLGRIARAAGHVVGVTSTDAITVGERLLEAGDWTGPGAARTVLRHPEVTAAVLEVARGGILRRGLAVDRCDAACVTNISADHLGEYGVDDLATMARAKAVVGAVVDPRGRVVLGADSEPLAGLVAAGHRFPAPVAWFALTGDHPVLAAHRAAGGEAWFVSPAGAVCRARGAAVDELVAVAELPLCFGGAAPHNVANSLAAAALAAAIGLSEAAIVAGLRSFTSSVADNPGRANVVRVGEVLVFLDFAHNAAGIRSLHPLLARLRGGHRLLVSIGVAGDRRDEDIREVARAVHECAPDRVIVRDLEHYLRGRSPGEVPALLAATLHALGVPADAVESADGEVEVLRRGLAWARPGDVVAILVHVDRDEVLAALRELVPGGVP
jgi:UDP-N-acetylmuramyl tripeptide synthase